jgi:hypothetical protein
VAKSHAKHAAAHWLESLGASNGFYKSGRHINFAIDRSEAMTATYVAAHRRHFRHTFSQTLCLLLLYAMASAGLLAMGGWLILQGELSVGQLVAAELILSGVFYGIAQLGGYLEVFYDLAAGMEELALFWDVPQEAPPAADAAPCRTARSASRAWCWARIAWISPSKAGSRWAFLLPPAWSAAWPPCSSAWPRPSAGWCAWVARTSAASTWCACAPT